MLLLGEGLQLFAASREPIRAEEFVQVRRGIALDAEMFVAPETVATAIDVARGDVDAADVGYVAINNDYLAVVAAVELRAKEGETQAAPRTDLYATLSKALQLASGQGVGADGIVEDTDTHARAGTTHKQTGNGTSQTVAAENVVLDKNLASCALQIADQGAEGLVGIVKGTKRVLSAYSTAALRVDKALKARVGRATRLRRSSERGLRRKPIEERGKRRAEEHRQAPHPRREGIEAAHDNP